VALGSRLEDWKKILDQQQELHEWIKSRAPSIVEYEPLHIHLPIPEFKIANDFVLYMLDLLRIASAAGAYDARKLKLVYTMPLNEDPNPFSRVPKTWEDVLSNCDYGEPPAFYLTVRNSTGRLNRNERYVRPIPELLTMQFPKDWYPFYNAFRLFEELEYEQPMFRTISIEHYPG
jgi:hypothetical protein